MWNPLKKKELSIPEILDRNRPPVEAEEANRAPFQAKGSFTALIADRWERAHAEGKSIEDILEAEFGSLNSSAGETQDCLKPLEVLQHSNRNSLPRQRMEHVNRCSWCTTLMASAVPVEKEFAAVLERARLEASDGIRQPTVAASASGSFGVNTVAAYAHHIQEKLFRG
jgi:hypothetical protein